MTSKESNTTQVAKIKIALVEDNVDLQRHLLDRIEASNLFSCVVVSEQVESFLEINVVQDLDLILLDNRLEGGVTGVEGLPSIKKRYPDVPVIIWTVMYDYDAIFEALLLGASDFIQKELNLDQIYYRLHEIQKQPCPVITPPIARRLIRFWDKNKIGDFGEETMARKVVVFLANGVCYSEVEEMLSLEKGELEQFIAKLLEKTRKWKMS